VIVDHASSTLDEVLHGLRLADSCYCRTELTAPWGLDMAECSNITFHFVAEGRCRVDFRNGFRELAAGDLVVFPRGSHHRLLGGPDVPPRWLLRLPLPGQKEPASYLAHGGGGEPALVLCGGAAFDPPDQPLVNELPDVMTVRGDDGWVGAALALMGREAAEARPGGETVIARLCDVLIIHAVREWLASSPEAQDGWLGALRDPHVGRALALIHEVPEEPHTVASLAAAAHLSRSAFAERFTTLMGMAPIAYLTRHRMRVATELLRDHRLSQSEVARRVGYGSVAAFSRAYSRTLGHPPSAVAA
jgi:AraC-like DNA-binding protein